MDKLKELLRERGWTYRELASSIGISEITFYRKVNGRQKWLASEVADIVRSGALTVGEAWDIFMRKEGEHECGSEADVETQAEREGVPPGDADGERDLHT